MKITDPDFRRYLKCATTFWIEIFLGMLLVYIPISTSVDMGLKEMVGSNDQTH